MKNTNMKNSVQEPNSQKKKNLLEDATTTITAEPYREKKYIHFNTRICDDVLCV